MSAPAQHHQFTYDDYRQMCENDRLGTIKFEYNRGTVYAMAGGTIAHARLTAQLSRLLGNLLHDDCAVFSPDLSIYIAAADAANYPDVSVVCGPVETKPGDTKAVINPTLLVEVLSPSTENYDRGDKLDDYKLIPSLRTVLLVSQHRPEIIVVERTAKGWQTTLARAGSTIMLEAPHVQLRVDDIYAGIELTPP